VGVGSKVKAGKGKEGADGNLMHREYRPDHIWVAPISTPAQIRQYRKELYDVAALPFATVVPAPISDDDDDPEICSDDSDDEPIHLPLDLAIYSTA
jgi:hypothetical protein